MSAASEHPYASALIECGVDPAAVALQWDNDCQEDILTFNCSELSVSTLERLAELHLTFPSRFLFNGKLQQAFDDAVQRTPAMRAARAEVHQHREDMLLSAGLSNFKFFDPTRETLEAFAGRAESACGFDRQQILTVSEDGELLMRLTAAEAGAKREALMYLVQRAAPDRTLRLLGKGIGS